MKEPIELLTLEEAAGILRCSTRTVRRRIKEGELSPITIGNKYLFEYSHIVDYIEKQKTNGGNENEE